MTLDGNDISALVINNFMSIADARLEFDDSNIISLCGYNDSGKSAVTRLLEVMFYNAYSADQAKFIKDGAEYWKGTLEFVDGVTLDRYKYQDGKSVWEMFKNDKLVYTNRLENGGIAAMSDTQDIIAQYLGVIQDEFTEEKLNVRRNTDRLFLINTTGGDNYKILNSVLQSETLAEASRQLTEDKNKLNTEVINFKTTRDVLRNQLAETEVAPTEVLEDLKTLLTKTEDVGGKLTRLTMLSELRSQLNAMCVHEEVQSVDISALALLQTAAEAFNVCNKSIVEEVTVVDISRLNELQSLAKLRSAMFIPMYAEVKSADATRYAEIMDVGTLYNTLYNANNAVYQTEQALNSAKQELTALSSQYNFKVCKNCGSIVE